MYMIDWLLFNVEKYFIQKLMARRRKVYKNNDVGITMAAWRDLDCHRENEDIDIGGRLWKSCLATGFQRPLLTRNSCKFFLASYVLDFLLTCIANTQFRECCTSLRRYYAILLFTGVPSGWWRRHKWGMHL